MLILWRLSFRALYRHPWRTLATSLGIALGMAAVLATLSVGANVEANLRQSLEAGVGGADLLVVPGTDGRAVFAVDEVLPQVRAVPGVGAVRAVLEIAAEPERRGDAPQGTQIPGFDTGFRLFGRPLPADQPSADYASNSTSDDLTANTAATEVDTALTLVRGALPTAGSQGIAVGAGFAEARSVAIGDEIRFASRFGDLSFAVTGILDDANGIASSNGGRVGIASLADVRTALRLPGRASYLEVEVTDDLRDVEARLADALGERYLVTLPANRGNVPTGISDTLAAGLRVLAATLVALGAFVAYNTFSADAVTRTREFALLRTLAFTRAQLRRLALYEALLIGVLGVLLGIGLGAGLAFGINYANALLLGYEVRTLVLPLPQLLVAAVVAVVSALVAAWIPAQRAARTSPLAARRQAMTAPPPRRPGAGVLLLVCGAAVALLPWSGTWSLFSSALAMGSLFFGTTLLAPTLLGPTFGLLRPLLVRLYRLPATLGSGFTERNSARNGVAVGAVTVGVSIVIGVGAMVAGINKSISDWVETTIVGDLFMSSPGNLPAGFTAQVSERVPEVEAVSGVAIRVVRLEPSPTLPLERARSISLILVEPERFHPERGFGAFQFIVGDAADGYDALADPDQVLVANTLAQRLGVTVGDTLALRTRAGTASFMVGGVIVDFTGGGEAVVMGLGGLERFGGGDPDLFVLTVRPGHDATEVAGALRDAFPDLPLDVTVGQAYRDEILAISRRSFIATNSLLVLAAIIAALGVANTLGMNLSERQHELALLRTLGLTRRGLQRLVLAEGTVVLTLGTLFGVVVGGVLATVITAGASSITGFPIAPSYPWGIGVAALLCAPLVGLLAALAPARQAGRLEPITALRRPAG
ncbi:MAG: FtsX-like permease family protein [Trueperaceae bacterium]|nr:FtsX-like permease family protein [Trueperaceae bacterium]